MEHIEKIQLREHIEVLELNKCKQWDEPMKQIEQVEFIELVEIIRHRIEGNNTTYRTGTASRCTEQVEVIECIEQAKHIQHVEGFTE